MSIDSGLVGDSILSRAAYGGGYRSGQHNNAGYDGSVVNSNLIANRDIGLLEAVNRSSSDQALAASIASGNVALSEQIRESTVSDRFATIERLLFANQNETQRELGDIKAANAVCCCETKAGLAAIEAKLDAQAEINKLNTELLILKNA